MTLSAGTRGVIAKRLVWPRRVWRITEVFFFSSRRRHTRLTCDWSSDVCSSDLDVDREAPTQLLVTTTTYDDYIGRIAVGRLQTGKLRMGQNVVRIDHQGAVSPAKVTQLFTFQGLARDEVEEAAAGDIVAVAGVDAGIGDTIADAAEPRA